MLGFNEGFRVGSLTFEDKNARLAEMSYLLFGDFEESGEEISFFAELLNHV